MSYVIHSYFCSLMHWGTVKCFAFFTLIQDPFTRKDKTMALTVPQTSILLSSDVPKLGPSLFILRTIKTAFAERLEKYYWYFKPDFLFIPLISCHLIHCNLSGYIALNYPQGYRNEAWEFIESKIHEDCKRPLRSFDQTPVNLRI